MENIQAANMTQPVTTKVTSKKKVKRVRVTGRQKFTAIAIITVVVLIGAGVLTILALRTVNNFFEGNHFAFHPIVEVKFNAPVTIEKRVFAAPLEATQSATPSASLIEKVIPKVNAMEKVGDNVVDVADLVSFVHHRETSDGKAPTGHHVNCRQKGLTNEYGYAPQAGTCFKTAEEAERTVRNWFTRELENHTVGQALCRYNIGEYATSCNYYKDYLAYEGSN